MVGRGRGAGDGGGPWMALDGGSRTGAGDCNTRVVRLTRGRAVKLPAGCLKPFWPPRWLCGNMPVGWRGEGYRYLAECHSAF